MKIAVTENRRKYRRAKNLLSGNGGPTEGGESTTKNDEFNKAEHPTNTRS